MSLYLRGKKVDVVESTEMDLALSTLEAAAKLDAGLPLLRGEALPLDGARLRQRWLDICAALAALFEHIVSARFAAPLVPGLISFVPDVTALFTTLAGPA